MKVERIKVFPGMQCLHKDYHCSEVSTPWTYAITKAVQRNGVIVAEFIRWSDEYDPPSQCLCKCDGCDDWRETKAEIDGPVIMPTE